MAAGGKQPRRVLWYKFSDGVSGEWSVYLVRRVDKDGSVGETVREKNVINILYSNDYTLMCRTLVHELVHAASSEHPGKVGEPLYEALHLLEEYNIRGQENRLLDIMRSSGWKVPEIPDAASALAA